MICLKTRHSRQTVHSFVGAFSSTQACSKGAFLHSVHKAPNITVFIPGTPLKSTHIQKHA